LEGLKQGLNSSLVRGVLKLLVGDALITAEAYFRRSVRRAVRLAALGAVALSLLVAGFVFALVGAAMLIGSMTHPWVGWESVGIVATSAGVMVVLYLRR
jgi:hypothetical protein